MSYEPTTWANGDIITATKLNNIESGVQSVSSSYTPTTWANGDIITATKLNNIEQGIANAGGGGGSSDFSTATVTVVNNSVRCVADIYNIFSAEGFEGLVSNAEIASNTTTVISAVLYKDYCEFYIDGFNGYMQTTGDASYEGDGFAIITGNCTITIS